MQSVARIDLFVIKFGIYMQRKIDELNLSGVYTKVNFWEGLFFKYNDLSSTYFFAFAIVLLLILLKTIDIRNTFAVNFTFEGDRRPTPLIQVLILRYLPFLVVSAIP